MCSQIIEDEEIFNKYFLKNFCSLSEDRVANVRITLSDILLQKSNDEKCNYIFKIKEV